MGNIFSKFDKKRDSGKKTPLRETRPKETRHKETPRKKSHHHPGPTGHNITRNERQPQNTTIFKEGSRVYMKASPSTWYYHRDIWRIVSPVPSREVRIQDPDRRVRDVGQDRLVKAPWYMDRRPVWTGKKRNVRKFCPGSVGCWVVLDGVEGQVPASELR